MQQFPFLQHEPLDLTFQISTQLARLMQPLYLKPSDDLSQRIKLITLFLNFHQLILKQGDLEHSSDWDPSLRILYRDNTSDRYEFIGNEPGFDIATISGDNLLLERPNDDGESPDEDEDCYYTIPVMNIAQLVFDYF